jgi:hypothetical protein
MIRHAPITVMHMNDKVTRDHVSALLLGHSPRAIKITVTPNAMAMFSDTNRWLGSFLISLRYYSKHIGAMSFSPEPGL